MKKTFRNLMAIAIAAMAFTACEDVPEPYNVFDDEQTVDDGTTQAQGSGTVADPYNVAGVLAYVQTLGTAESTEQVYVKGIVASITEIAQGNYGNATYTISDDGTGNDVFTVYRSKNLGNTNFTSADQLAVGDEVVVVGKVVNYNGRTPEFVQNASYLYSRNGKTSGGSSETASSDPKGTGTQADPFNVAAAIAKCKEIGESPSTEKYYVKGIAAETATADASFGNASFNIVDVENGEKFYCFQVAGTDGKKMPSGYTIKKGDVVVVYGPIYNYKGNTPETAGKSAAYVVSVNGKSTEGGNDNPQPTNNSTLDNPYTVAQALATANSLDDNATTTDSYYIKGKVTRKANTADEIGPNSEKKYSDMNYYISDDGSQTSELYVYRGKFLDGADFTDYEQIKEGDEVVIYGQLQKYIDARNGNAVIPEVKNSKIVKLNGQSGGNDNPNPNPQPGGQGGTLNGNVLTVNAAEFGFSTDVAASTATLAGGTKVTFSKASGSSDPKFYSGDYASVRVYANNTITIEGSKKIASIAITTTDPSGSTKYNGSDLAYAEASARVDVVKESDTSIKFDGLNSNNVTIVNYSEKNSGNQLRISQMVITFAE